ncbi:Retrovirus-related Pol polyprotein from transposon TNT 1-94 [Sesamum angolense]|uniref:Retrovirus-related Pol polyprotein from transposon TNT 1-94 n=1 Tax=Sesamum angolense TaxID=2727404 RepID=A0AAE1T6B9_9LAMI|nr:Retrovirus-related Pol polyprotein from transposon TNT 1-94 [Sesamum angolense]
MISYPVAKGTCNKGVDSSSCQRAYGYRGGCLNGGAPRANPLSLIHLYPSEEPTIEEDTPFSDQEKTPPWGMITYVAYTKVKRFFLVEALRVDRHGHHKLCPVQSEYVARTMSFQKRIHDSKLASYKYLGVWGSPAYVKRLVGNKLDSRSSLCRFVGYLKETSGYCFYDLSEQKVFVLRNVVFLKKGFLVDSRRDKVLLEEPSEAPQQNDATLFEPMASTYSVPVLHRSTRETRPRDRYRFLGLTSQLDNDPRTYRESMLDMDSDKWLEAMRFKMDSMGSNQVWTLVDPLKMDTKMIFLNGFVKEDIYIDQSEGFTFVGEEQKVYCLERFIYGLKQTCQSWSTRFDEVIRGYDFIKNKFDPCVYKKIGGNTVAYIVLYVDNILLIGNDFKLLGNIRAWLSTQVSMKDIGEASYIIGIKIYRDRSRKISLRRLMRSLRGYQTCSGDVHWSAIKTILKYLKRTKDMFLIYGGRELILEGYSDASFQSGDDDAKSQSSFVLKLNGGVVAWKSSKQATTTDSTIEVE